MTTRQPRRDTDVTREGHNRREGLGNDRNVFPQFTAGFRLFPQVSEPATTLPRLQAGSPSSLSVDGLKRTLTSDFTCQVFTRKGDAQRFLDGVCSDLAHGAYVDPAAVGDRLIAS